MASTRLDMVSQQLLDQTINLFTCSFQSDTDVKELVNTLIKNVQWSKKGAIDLLMALLKRTKDRTDRENVYLWVTQVLHSIQINFVTPELKIEKGKTIIEVVSDASKSDDQISVVFKSLQNEEEKPLEEILEEIRQNPLNQTDESVLEKVKDTVSSVNDNFPLAPSGPDPDGLKINLFELSMAVKATQKWKPRLTQMVSWCLLALSKSGWLIQVGAGEGKSCIVAMFAAFRAREGGYVDILSSSSVLAERDLEKWRSFYKRLYITVNCNTNKLGDYDLKKCYKSRVVYGSAGSFAGDYLRHSFQKKEVRGQRSFDCAIVDEVDSLMLDKGLQMVYLSNEMPTMQHLNALWARIWCEVNQYHPEDSEITVGPLFSFDKIILNHIDTNPGEDVDQFVILQMAEDTGTIPKGSVKEIRKNSDCILEKMEGVDAHQLAMFLEVVETQFPSCHFELHHKTDQGKLEQVNIREQGDDSNKKRVPLLYFKSGGCRHMYSNKEEIICSVEEAIKSCLTFTPCKMSQDTVSCYVPGFLKELIDSKLKAWIENAFRAKTITLGHEYILEADEIIPVDYSCRGVVENCMKWSDGLKQFLELKHETKMSNMSVITNFMTNVCLFQKYQGQLFGISGTLGDKVEIETLQKLYTGIKTCQIPSFKRRKVFEVEGLITNNEKEWLQKICCVVESQINPTFYRSPRAVLVICETINRAKVLHEAFELNNPVKKLYINNNEDNSFIGKQHLEAGDIIVATNLAGRGTDLKVSNQVNRAGGLFVLQTFLPQNSRVEKQAFDRTGRQGNPGSSQIIICHSHLSETLQSLITQLSHLQVEKDHTLPPTLTQDDNSQIIRSFSMALVDNNDTRLDVCTKSNNSQITLAKKLRETVVSKKLSTYLEKDVPSLRKKAELFSKYVNLLDEVHTAYSASKLHDSFVSSLNETWGMWLLVFFNESDSTEDLLERLETTIQEAKRRLDNRLSPTSITHHHVMFGNALRCSGNLSDSTDAYTKAIQEDCCWAAIALYNRAFNTLKTGDNSCITSALGDLEEVIESFKFYQSLIRNTIVYSKLATENSLSRTITRLEKQLRTRDQVLECFKANVTEAIAKLNKARDMGESVSLEEKSFYFLVPIHCLIYLEEFVQPVFQVLTSNARRRQQHLNHPSFDVLYELSSLHSFGLTTIFTLNTRFSLGGFLTKIFKL